MSFSLWFPRITRKLEAVLLNQVIVNEPRSAKEEAFSQPQYFKSANYKDCGYVVRKSALFPTANSYDSLSAQNGFKQVEMPYLSAFIKGYLHSIYTQMKPLVTARITC